MTQKTKKETRAFEAQTHQLLQLMVHSLYSHREIFLRELISNASDALDKLRFESYTQPELEKDRKEPFIDIEIDAEAKTLTIRDTGLGMNYEEVVSNIGTIAHSGTAEFARLVAQAKDKKQESALIGQFGVGFYASFMVAERVEIFTRRAGLGAEEGVHWESTGEGEYLIEKTPLETVGTTVVLHLRADAEEFLEPYRIEHIVRKYSDHITFPVRLREPEQSIEEDGEQEAVAEIYRTLNKATALWTRARKEISEDEYKEFYAQFAYDPEPPFAHLHSRVEGKQAYTFLVYLPSRAPFDLWDRDRRQGVKLYVKRVFIMDDAEHLLPTYLRFVRGVVDSDDLPLNVSREILQSNKLVDSMRSGITKKVLDYLETAAEKEAERYQEFWLQFGRVLKEGVVEDTANRDRLLKLYRFSSTVTEPDSQSRSLEDYLAAMPEKQEKIYYLTADSDTAARYSPHLEAFRSKGIEVLLLTDPIDEWLVGSIPEFSGKPLQSVAQGTLDIAGAEDADDAKNDARDDAEADDLMKKIAAHLDDRVTKVRASSRLTESPACLVAEQGAVSIQMQRLMKAAGQSVPESRPVLELNPDHPLVKRLESEQDEARFGEIATLLYEQALLSEGGQLENPASFVRRINELMF